MIEHHFTKHDYQGENPWFYPLLVAFLLGFIIYQMVKLGVALKNRRCRGELHSLHDIIEVIFFPTFSCVAVVYFLICSIWPTYQYSMYLPFESEEEAYTFCGEIESIKPAPNMKYHVGDETYTTPGLFYSGRAERPPLGRGPTILTSGDKEFYIINAEGVCVGMHVEIRYLPRSRMVLDCVQVDNTTKTGQYEECLFR